MLKRLALLLLLAGGLALSFGCSSSRAGLSPTQHLRRVMIAGEQLKISAQGFEQIFELEDYPIGGKWNY